MVLQILFLCVTPAFVGPEAVITKPLAHAYRDGDVKVEARSHSGYSITQVRIRNTSHRDITVDVNGSYLRPSASRVQRIGFGLVRAGSGDTSVRLKPSERVSLKLLTVCMDAPKSSPGRTTRFELAKTLAPPEQLKVLRHWKANPRISQGQIQSAVWGHRVPEPPRPPATPGLKKETTKVVPYAGGMFVLDESRDLLFGERPTRLAALPGDVFDVWAGSNAYAIRETIGKGRTDVIRTVISSFDRETRGWSNLDLRAVPGELIWVSPRETTALIRTLDGNIRRVTSSSSRTVVRGVREVAVTRSGDVYWVSNEDPRVLCKTDLRGAKTKKYRHGMTIRRVVSAGDSIYFHDLGDRLQIVDGGSGPRWLRGDVSFIQAAGDRLLVGTNEEIEGFEIRSGSLHYYEGAEDLGRFPYPKGKPKVYFYDRAAETLFCDGTNGHLRQFDKQRGTWKKIRLTTGR